MENNKELFEALSKAQAQIKAAGKSSENKFDHYKYSTLEDYWRVVQAPMSDNGLSFPVTVSMLKRLDDRVTSNNKKERAVEVQLTGKLCHSSGQYIEIISYGEGQDRSDKAIYKAITGARKYLLSLVFNIPTTDDPEKDSDTNRYDLKKNEQEPQSIPDAPQKISKNEFEELVGLCKEKNIKKDNWLKYLKGFSVNSASELTGPQYNIIKNVLNTSSHIIDPGLDGTIKQ